MTPTPWKANPQNGYHELCGGGMWFAKILWTVRGPKNDADAAMIVERVNGWDALMAEASKLDAVVHALGIEDSEADPADTIVALISEHRSLMGNAERRIEEAMIYGRTVCEQRNEFKAEIDRLTRCEAQWRHRAEVAENALVTCMNERHAARAARAALSARSLEVG